MKQNRVQTCRTSTSVRETCIKQGVCYPKNLTIMEFTSFLIDPYEHYCADSAQSAVSASSAVKCPFPLLHHIYLRGDCSFRRIVTLDISNIVLENACREQ